MPPNIPPDHLPHSTWEQPTSLPLIEHTRMNTKQLLEPASQLNFGYDSAVISSLQANLKLQPDKRRAVFLAEKMRVDFVFHTAALEGNPITFPEVQTLLDGIIPIHQNMLTFHHA